MMRILFKLSPMDVDLRRDIQPWPGVFITTDDVAKLNRELRGLMAFHMDAPEKLVKLGIKKTGEFMYQAGWKPNDYMFLGNEHPMTIRKMLDDWNDDQNARVVSYLDEVKALVQSGANPDDPQVQKAVSRLKMAIADWAGGKKTVSAHMVVNGYESIRSRIDDATRADIEANPQDWAVLRIRED